MVKIRRSTKIPSYLTSPPQIPDDARIYSWQRSLPTNLLMRIYLDMPDYYVAPFLMLN